MIKKILIVITLLMGILLITSCKDSSDVLDQAANIAQATDENVLMVKKATSTLYPDITYEKAFESFFAYPTWKHFEGTITENDDEEIAPADKESKVVDVVEFTGYCKYHDVEVKALIQFILDKESNTFSTHYLAFNDVPQDNLTLNLLLHEAFESAGGVMVEQVEKELIATFKQVGLYNHEAYSYLSEEYLPTVFLYSDNTFEFQCNYYEAMATYGGTWYVEENEASADYYFNITNHHSIENLSFKIGHNKSRCDADFYSEFENGDNIFGMTSVDDILFHIEYTE